MPLTIGALNRSGNALRRLGFDRPRLDRESIVNAAINRAGSESFGSWPFHEPLDRLLSAYEKEAALSTIGRLSVRELLVSLLANLIHLERERKDKPAITDETIDAPIVITGLPRTGTTLLHGLIAQDPGVRTPKTWEVMYPAGFERTAQEIASARRRTNARLAWANRLAPEFRRIHEIDADLPQECIAIMAQGLFSIQFHTTHHVPSYQDWFEQHGQRRAYEFHHRLLQHLQAKSPGGRWVLKAPGHLFGLGELLARYPDACIVHTHRDPVAVMGSIASLVTVLRRAFSDHVDPTDVGNDWCRRWGDALDRSLITRDSNPDTSFLDLGFDELASDPLVAVENVYDFAGLTLKETTRTAMQRFLDANPKNKFGTHRYSLRDFGLDRSQLRQRFAPYCERFGIPLSASS
jgi:hypothetical protein